MNEQKCKDCKWLDCYKGDYVCGYIAEVYNVASMVDPESPCEINKYQKKG